MTKQPSQQQQLEDLILGNDTNDEDILTERVKVWMEFNGFDTEGLEDEDPVGFLAEAISQLTPVEMAASIKLMNG
jgi:hypothetical protein